MSPVDERKLFARGATYRPVRSFSAPRDEFVAGEPLHYWRFATSVYDGMQGYFFFTPDGERVKSWDMDLGAKLDDVPFARSEDVAEMVSAAASGDAARTLALLDQSASDPERGATRRLALEAAIEARRAAVVGAMVARPVMEPWRARALADAAMSGETLVVSALLAAGVSANVADDGGQTPLGWAVYEGHDAVVDVLLRAGADPARDRRGLAGMVDFAKKRGWSAIVGRLERLRR